MVAHAGSSVQNGTPTRGAGSVAAWTTADQVLASGSNALMVCVLAQVSSAGQFGIIALLITVLAVCTGFTRGALGTPLLLTSNLGDRQIVAEASFAVTWSLCSGAVGGVLILVMGAAFEHPWIGFAFAISLPAVLAQDVLRMTAIGLSRPGLAVLADTLWAGAMLVIFGANLLGVRASAELSIYLWGLGGLIAATILASRLRVVSRHSGIIDWWRASWPARAHYGSVYSISLIGITLVTFAAVMTAGSVSAAGIRGAFTLFGPIATLLSAMPAVFVPHALRTGSSPGDQWRLLSRASLATSMLTLAAAGALIGLPAGVGTALLGASWRETSLVMPYVGAAHAAMCWYLGALTVFQSRGASKTVFGLSTLHVGLQVAVCFAAGLIFGSAIAIACALAVSSAVSAAIGVFWVHRSLLTVASSSLTSPESAVAAAGESVIR